MLKKEIVDRFYFIIGETSYGLCCADEVAARHLPVDLIIRVGDTCMTKTKNIPVFFLVEQNRSTDVSKFLNELDKFDANVFIFYDFCYIDSFNSIENTSEKLKIGKCPYNPSIYQDYYNPTTDLVVYS